MARGMGVEGTTTGPEPELKRDAVGMWGSIFQGLTHMAPAAGVMTGIGFCRTRAATRLS